MRPEGAEWLLQQDSGQPDPTELNVPSQSGSHTLILIAPTSRFLLVCTVPAPYTIPASSNCMAITLPLLKLALALLLPLSQRHGCVTDRCPHCTHTVAGAGECWPEQVSLVACWRLLRNECQVQQQKATFPQHQCPQLPTTSMQRDKVHMRVGYVSVQVQIHRTSARGFLGRRTLKHFPLPRHSTIKQTLFITWLTCQQGNPLP